MKPRGISSLGFFLFCGRLLTLTGEAVDLGALASHVSMLIFSRDDAEGGEE
jgi:hypothetical protein